MKTALVTGATGQDGSFMVEHLLNLGYVVHAFVRRTSGDYMARLRDTKAHIHYGDVQDPASLRRCVDSAAFDEVYHFADQDNVDYSFKTPKQSVDVTYGGTATLLETVGNKPRVLIPVSATVFACDTAPQTESSRLAPNSPYACAKAAVWHLARYYRDVLGRHIVCPILYNHDSERRGHGYLLHKIAKAAVEVARGTQKTVELHSTYMRVDIGYAKEYVQFMHWLMQYYTPTDCIVSTGKGCSIKELWIAAAKAAGVKEPLDHLREAAEQYRPGDVRTLVGDNTRLSTLVGTVPLFTGYDVVKLLVEKYKCA